jgi:hypothetical protein
MFLIKKLTFDQMNFLKLSVHVFCLAEKAKLRRTNSRTNCQQNKITVCPLNRDCLAVAAEYWRLSSHFSVKYVWRFTHVWSTAGLFSHATI